MQRAQKKRLQLIQRLLKAHERTAAQSGASNAVVKGPRRNWWLVRHICTAVPGPAVSCEPVCASLPVSAVAGRTPCRRRERWVWCRRPWLMGGPFRCSRAWRRFTAAEASSARPKPAVPLALQRMKRMEVTNEDPYAHLGAITRRMLLPQLRKKGAFCPPHSRRARFALRASCVWCAAVRSGLRRRRWRGLCSGVPASSCARMVLSFGASRADVRLWKAR